MTEIEVFLEHWERYRSVTLQCIDLLEEAELGWRPQPEAQSCAQQLLHIVQNEDYFIRGIFEGDWDTERLRFPREMPAKEALRRHYVEVRDRTLARLRALGAEDLDRPTPVPRGPTDMPLRWWLWLMLEHEVHHKAQLAVYFRLLNKVPPYFAAPLPPGDRPDVRKRAELGGV
ncbi:MAG: DinB family protein [Gemmatimonadetes bacterium]|nr:DinB family protein [Gemmatimonadota bacterium]